MANDNRPMSLEELSRLPSVGDKQPPAELGESRVFLSPTNGARAAASAQALDLRAVSAPGQATAGFEVASGDFSYGLNVTSAQEAPPPPKGGEETLEPYRPDWSGIDYLPRLADPVEPGDVHMLRRRNGRRVRPDGHIFGRDDRQVYYPSGYPWRCIGRLFVWTNANNASWSWWGTAALVADNAILTASHVAPWGSVDAGVTWKAQFVSGYYDGSSVNGAGGSAWVTGLWGYKNHAQGDDMAVMALNSPLGNTLGYFGYKTYTDAWEDGPWWTKCGYPSMITGGQRPSRQSSFPIQDDDNDGAGVELEYEADSSGGDSGGPVFGWWDGKPYVIGTHSGGEEEVFDTNNVAAGGAALSSLIKWARDNW